MIEGKVEVNGFEIMAYQITNEGQLFTETDDSDHTTYAFTVWGTDIGGYPYNYHFVKDVLTKDNKGAATLIAILMHEVEQRQQTRYFGVNNP